MRVALIGSFRRERYGFVTDVIKVFSDAGMTVVSPSGSEITSGEEFVRFATDHPDWSDEQIQSVTLKNIFSADFVYVVDDDGYVGKTTCYEIGRIIQRQQPIYFMEPPGDFPVHIPRWAVGSAKDLVLRFESGEEPQWLYEREAGDHFDVERSLVC
jgi:hypothetical protein